jgi:hypothetical protein
MFLKIFQFSFGYDVTARTARRDSFFEFLFSDVLTALLTLSFAPQTRMLMKQILPNSFLLDIVLFFRVFFDIKFVHFIKDTNVFMRNKSLAGMTLGNIFRFKIHFFEFQICFYRKCKYENFYSASEISVFCNA